MGFRKMGKRFFFIRENDVMGLLAVERPSGLVYLQFAIIPLFLPCLGNLYYSYGRRLNDLYYDFPVLDNEADEEEIEEYCRMAIWRVEHDLLPQLKKISTGDALQKFAENGSKLFAKKHDSFIFCTPEEMKYLFMYSSLYIKDYKKALLAAKKYTSYVQKVKYWTEAVKAKKLHESNRIMEAIISGKYEEIDEMFKRNIAENLNLFPREKENTRNTGDGSLC